MGDLNIDYKTEMTLLEAALIHICATATRLKGTCANTSSGGKVQVLNNVADSVCKTTFVGDNLGHINLNVFECSRLHTGNTSERFGGTLLTCDFLSGPTLAWNSGVTVPVLFDPKVEISEGVRDILARMADPGSKVTARSIPICWR